MNSDVNKLSGFIWWKKQTQFSYLIFVLITTSLLTLCSIAIYNIAVVQKEHIPNIILILAVLGLFAVFDVFMFKALLGTINCRIHQYWYCPVVSFHRNTGRKNDTNSYYIILDVDGKEIEANCYSKTYHTAQKGQTLLLFTVDDKCERFYCVHPEM